jgi:hypothetical protein
MTRTITTLTAIGGVALATAGPAGGEPMPPIEHDTRCSIETPKVYRLGQVLRRGFPVEITCNGPASVTADLDITEHSRKVSDYIANAYSGGYPGIPARTPYRELAHRLDQAGTITARMRLSRYARPILRRFAPFPVEVTLSIETAEGSWWTLQNVKRPLIRR